MTVTDTNSSSADNQTQTPIEALSAVLMACAGASGAKKDARDDFLISANLVQTAQKVFTNAGPDKQGIVAAAHSALEQLSLLPWSSVHFPLAQTLLSQTYSDIFTRNHVRDSDKYRILSESLYTFLVLAQDNPELAREDILRSIVEEGALSAQVAKAPELNYRANVLKIFSPNKVASIDLEPLQVIIYRGELIGGGFGPERWGLAHVVGDTAHVLLETGEYLRLPSVSLCLAVTHDYDTSELPPYLLACAKLFLPNFLRSLSSAAQDLATADRLDKTFGNFSSDALIQIINAPAAEIAPCEMLLDAARTGAHDISSPGVMRTFDVSGTSLQIIVTAQQAAVRPYVSATLVDSSSGTIYMRLDVPREFSASGIYFFPLENKSAALIVI